MDARYRILIFLAALSFLLGWTANPATCSAQCYQVSPVQVYNYSLLPAPNCYAYTLPAPAPVGYYVAASSPWPYKYKHRHKYKHKCRYEYEWR